MNQHHQADAAIAGVIDAIANDIGRLRRRTAPGSSLDHLVGRLTDQLETLDAIVQPTAHDLYQDNLAISGDHQIALEEALRHITARQRQFRLQLGRDPDGYHPVPVVLVEAQAAA